MSRLPIVSLVAVTVVGSACAREHKLDTELLDPSYRGFTTETYDEDALQPGTLFFSDGSDQTAPRVVEVDRAGKVQWQWVVPAELVNSNTIMDSTPTPEGGALLVVDAIGVLEVDHAGDIIARYDSLLPSHDVDLLDNGNWLVTNGWSRKGEPHFMEVTPEGDIAWSWDGLDQYDTEPFDIVYREGWIHANAAERLDDGSTLVSLRNFNRVALLDSVGDVEWEVVFSHIEPEAQAADLFDVAKGVNPHEPELTPDGTLLVAVHQPNVVLEVDLATREVIWSWSAEVDGATKIRDVNRLPNGNTLVTSTEAVLELDPTGTVIWRLDANLDLLDPNAPADLRPFYKASLVTPDGTVYGG